MECEIRSYDKNLFIFKKISSIKFKKNEILKSPQFCDALQEQIHFCSFRWQSRLAFVFFYTFILSIDIERHSLIHFLILSLLYPHDILDTIS